MLSPNLGGILMGNKTKKILMLCVLLLGCVVTGLWTYDKENASSNEVVKQLVSASREEKRRLDSRTIKVYISGAVLMPGIYDIPMGSRAYNAVEAAGGMTNDADADRVNLAKKLKDGDHVNVPFMKQGRAKGSITSKASNPLQAALVTDSSKNSSVNINTASQSELDSLPGIGPAMAKRIIAEREKAPFTSVDDLLRVKGIGKAKLGKLRSRIRVN